MYHTLYAVQSVVFIQIFFGACIERSGKIFDSEALGKFGGNIHSHIIAARTFFTRFFWSCSSYAPFCKSDQDSQEKGYSLVSCIHFRKIHFGFCPGGGMVDTRDLKSLSHKRVRVRAPSWAPNY